MTRRGGFTLLEVAAALGLAAVLLWMLAEAGGIVRDLHRERRTGIAWRVAGEARDRLRAEPVSFAPGPLAVADDRGRLSWFEDEPGERDVFRVDLEPTESVEMWRLVVRWNTPRRSGGVDEVSLKLVSRP